MPDKLIAYFGKPEVKKFYLDRVRAHRKADQLIRGVYWEKGKGCAIGCTIHGSNHAAYETELGIPILLANLEDGIFESLPNGQALEWPENFLSAIEPGADLSGVWPQFAIWLLVDPKWGVLQFAKPERTKKSIREVADAYRSVVDGEHKDLDWKALRSAAAFAAARANAYAAAAFAYDANADDADANAAAAGANAANAAGGAFTTDAADAAYAANAYAAAAFAYDANADDADAAYAAYAAFTTGGAFTTDAADAKRKWRSAQAEKILELLAAAPMVNMVSK